MLFLRSARLSGTQKENDIRRNAFSSDCPQKRWICSKTARYSKQINAKCSFAHSRYNEIKLVGIGPILFPSSLESTVAKPGAVLIIQPDDLSRYNDAFSVSVDQICHLQQNPTYRILRSRYISQSKIYNIKNKTGEGGCITNF
ncbi:hypothetical protein PUN28_011054 [Cardiocondyla obscurior]|uniref:Uncharacterized protein n=1 Tax=Cardiocondyla obscurior TaxID=286306 RepID=A0AAW2FLD1_9HYME